MNAMANLNECFACGIPLDFEERANLLAQEFSAALQKNVGNSLEQDEKIWQVILKSAGQLGGQAIGVATLTALAVTGVVGTFADPSSLSSIEPDLLSAALTKLVPAGQGAVGFWLRDFAQRLVRKKVGWFDVDEERQDVQRTEITKLINEIACGDLLSTEFIIGLSGLVKSTSLVDGLEEWNSNPRAVQQTRELLGILELLPTVPLSEASVVVEEIAAAARETPPFIEQIPHSSSYDSGHLQHRISQYPQYFNQQNNWQPEPPDSSNFFQSSKLPDVVTETFSDVTEPYIEPSSYDPGSIPSQPEGTDVNWPNVNLENEA